MATTKNALIRFKVLDNCFRNVGRKYFINDLISECENVLLDIDPQSNGISRRQIYDDISFMESAEGWSIELEKHRDRKKVYYRYADMSFSINKMPLNEIEIKQLKDNNIRTQHIVINFNFCGAVLSTICVPRCFTLRIQNTGTHIYRAFSPRQIVVCLVLFTMRCPDLGLH